MYALLYEQETILFLLSMARQIQLCIGFIDLSFISVHTKVIKTCINFYVACILLPSVFQHVFTAKQNFAKNGWFLFSGSQFVPFQQPPMVYVQCTFVYNAIDINKIAFISSYKTPSYVYLQVTNYILIELPIDSEHFNEKRN